MKFEWDYEKHKSNLAKHQLDFADAPRIFNSLLRITLDERQDYEEERWIGLGMLNGRIIVIVFTEPDEDTISHTVSQDGRLIVSQYRSRRDDLTQGWIDQELESYGYQVVEVHSGFSGSGLELCRVAVLQM